MWRSVWTLAFMVIVGIVSTAALDDIELEDPVALLPDNIDDTDYFSPLRISRSGWKLRAGKRAAIWKLRGGKRSAQGALWKLRSMKRDGILDDKRAELWKLRTGKRASDFTGDDIIKREALWKLRTGKRGDVSWKLRTGKRAEEEEEFVK